MDSLKTKKSEIVIRMSEYLALCEALKTSDKIPEPARWFMQRAENLLYSTEEV